MSNIKNSESGIISMFVTTMLIILLSLLVLAFSQISRREQRQSLDTQLSTQAFYAAESGVNDAKQAIQTFVATGQEIPATTGGCKDTSGNYNFTYDLDVSSKVSYTCLMIDPDPKALPYTVGSLAQVVPLINKSGDPITSIKISWSGDSTSSSLCPVTTTNVFSPSGSWTCPYGGIRMDLVPTNTALSTDSLLNQNMTAFLIPTRSGGGTVSYTSGAGARKGATVAASGCNSGSCSVTVTGLSSPEYYMRISQLYKSSPATIVGFSGATPVEFKNAEALIDVTGKAQDVLRRIVVSAPLTQSNGKVPNAALNSADSVCKRFNVSEGYFANKTVGSFAGGNADNSLCTGP